MNGLLVLLFLVPLAFWFYGKWKEGEGHRERLKESGMTPAEYEKYCVWVGQQGNTCFEKFESEQAMRNYYINNVLTKKETASSSIK